MMREVVLLGSTGSIGTQALDIVARNPESFRVIALAAGGANLDLLADQALDTGAQIVAIADQRVGDDFHNALARRAAARGLTSGGFRYPEVLLGEMAATEVAARPCDVVLNGMTGSVGLKPTLAALTAGTTLALANKESLVVGGSVVTSRAKPGQIVPVDSEHSALAQCLRAGSVSEVRRLILTASGGPFRGWSREQLANVTPQQALNHPTWDMGPVVTVNSATLVNKGLEVIEAHLLFGIDYSAIATVVHPQSIIHSMVEFNDGSTIAQASPPDMRLPIALGLSWPNRTAQAAPSCDWTQAATWEFLPLDESVFRAVKLARLVGEHSGTAPAVFNAANEECVSQFLEGNLAFGQIVDTVERVVDTHLAAHGNDDGSGFVPDGELSAVEVLAAEAWARPAARQVIRG